MCKVKSCARPAFVGGLCGFHALQGTYQAEAGPAGLTVRRVRRPPVELAVAKVGAVRPPRA